MPDNTITAPIICNDVNDSANITQANSAAHTGCTNKLTEENAVERWASA
jgi:hypothetical protein